METMQVSTDRWMDIHEWIYMHAYTHTMEHCVAIKKNEITPLVPTRMGLELMTLSEVSQMEKGKYHMMSLICGI